MNITIKAGSQSDIDRLERLYNDINDYLTATTNYPGWKKDVYPTRQDAQAGVRDGCLYTATYGNELAGSIVLRNGQEPAYSQVKWQAPFDDSEVLVIHTLVVNPKYLRNGIGEQLLGFAYAFASEHGYKALRLDVYEKNAPAMALYEKCGFIYTGTVSLGLESRGLNFFNLYERLI